MKDSPWPDLRQQFQDAAVVYPACELNYARAPAPFRWPPFIGGPSFTSGNRAVMFRHLPGYVEHEGAEKLMQCCFCMVCEAIAHYSHAMLLFSELAEKAGNHVRDTTVAPVRADDRVPGEDAIAIWEATLVNKLRERRSPFVQRGNEYWSIRNPFHASAQIIEDFMPKHPTASTPIKSKPPRRRRRKRAQAKRDPTPTQIEAIQIVGECKGNLAEAARRLGKDRKTVAEAYYTGLDRLGLSQINHGTQAMPTDRRGQGDIASHDDGPANIGPKARVRRDQRR